MKRQLNISIEENLWFRIHTEIKKGDVTKISELLWKSYFDERENGETDVDRIDKEIKSIENQIEEFHKELVSKRIFKKKYEEHKKQMIEEKRQRGLEIIRALNANPILQEDD